MHHAFVQRKGVNWHYLQVQEEDEYNITKEMIGQLRETGMNWTSKATCLVISVQRGF